MDHSDPIPFWPRGMTPEYAARYVGLPLATFVQVAAEKGLRPRQFGSRRRYDRLDIDRTFFDDPLATQAPPGSGADWANML